MIRFLTSVIIILTLISCSTGSKINKPETNPEIPTPILKDNGIVTIIPNYKSRYFRSMPYLLKNKHGIYNQIQGDFYNVKFNTNSNLNISAGYWNRYGPHKNSLTVLIAMTGTSTIPIKNIPIVVKSKKHGIFEKTTTITNSDIDRIQQRVLFVKPLELENPYDILNKIHDDVITVTVGGQVYEFINPELELH